MTPLTAIHNFENNESVQTLNYFKNDMVQCNQILLVIFGKPSGIIRLIHLLVFGVATSKYSLTR